ncbi:MAG: sugar transferase [Acidobacteria bacterium]|nr:sugar transferase [Acidobacteriota bacterium]
MKSEALEHSLARNTVRSITHPIFQNFVFLSIVDLAIGFLAYVLAWIIRITLPIPYTSHLLPGERWDIVTHPWLLLALSQIFFLYIFGLYDDLRLTRHREIIRYLFLACVLQVTATASLFYFSNRIFPRTILVLFDACNLLMLLAWRSYVKAQLQRRTLKVLIVGEGFFSASEIVQEIERNPGLGMQIAGFVMPEQISSPNAGDANYPVLGTLEDIPEIIRTHDVDEIIFTSEETWKDRVLNSISKIQEEVPVHIAILPSVYEIVIGKLRHINIHDSPLIEVKKHPNEPFERIVKRGFDFCLAAFLIVLLFPVFLIVALAIKIISPGSVFYLQERVGYEEKIFRLIKFRTMVPNAEKLLGETLAQVNDPRVTSIGRFLRRFRIDELPQLINVLKGDMSFVGPRPERPGFVKMFQERLPGYRERHKVKPGMTGLAQVRSHYHTNPENKLKYDLAYMYNYSFSLDLLILLETIKVVLIRKGS